MAAPQYAILRFAKYKGPEISGVEAHNERTKEKYASNPDIDHTRTHLNFHLIKPERKYRAESEKQIAEAGCRTRSDSVRVVEALITATPEFSRARKEPRSKSSLVKPWSSSSRIKPPKPSYPLWCIWTRKIPICTFVLSR